MRVAVAVLLALPLWAGAQGLQVRLEGCPEIGTVHLEREDAVTGRLRWVDAALVDAGRAVFAVEPGAGERWAVEAPPYTWRLTTRAGEVAVAVCHCPDEVPMRLRNVYGTVDWETPDGEAVAHPMGVLEGLAVAALTEFQELEYDLMSATGAVGSRSFVSDSVWSEATARMEGVFSAAEEALTERWAHDALLRERLNWAVTTGAGDAELRDALAAYLTRDDRHPNVAFRSKPLRDAAVIAWANWWEEVDVVVLGEALKARDAEAVADAMGPAAAQADWAWWVWAQAQPTHPVVTRAFAMWTGPAAFVEGVGQILRPQPPVPPEGWTTRSGALERFSEVCPGMRTVLLLVKDGSTAALRERALFAQLAESNQRRDVQFFVVSLDPTESAWQSTQADRTSRSEQLRWIGADPRALQAWSISTVPTTVILGSDGDPLPGRQLLPSEGLGATIERWPR